MRVRVRVRVRVAASPMALKSAGTTVLIPIAGVSTATSRHCQTLPDHAAASN